MPYRRTEPLNSSINFVSITCGACKKTDEYTYLSIDSRGCQCKLDQYTWTCMCNPGNWLDFTCKHCKYYEEIAIY